MSVGENIRQARTQKNITQKELGEKLGGIPQQQIGRWENGKSTPKLDTIKKIATALEVSMTDLIGTVGNIAETSASTMESAVENISETIIDISTKMQMLSKDEKALIYNYQKLNNIGKNEARKRVHELTEIPRYTQKEMPDKRDK